MLLSYIKIAVKVLRRRKFYTFVSLFGIAFTLQILNVVAAGIDHTFSAAQPESKLDRILSISNARMWGDRSSSSSAAGYALLDGFARNLPGVEEFSIVSRPGSVAAYVDGQKLEPAMRRTDAALWRILDYEFIEGAPYTSADVDNGSFYAVINETTRDRFFDGQSAAGKSIRLDDQTFTVIGVVKDVPLMRWLAFSEVWVPLTTAKSTSYRHELLGNLTGILLASSRSDFSKIREELAHRLSEAQLPDPDNYHTLAAGAFTRYEEIAYEVLGGAVDDRPTTKGLSLIIALFALMFMALPALNLINLSLSRILERAPEIGVRKAFGASSTTLVGQFLVESVILTLLGGLIGLVLSVVSLQIIGNADVIPYARLSLNLRATGYGILLALVFALISGAYPAWRMSRLHPVDALHGRSA